MGLPSEINPLAVSGDDYNIQNSLRFRGSASTYLNRTFSATGSQAIFTYSAWVKRAALSAGTFQALLGAYYTTGYFTDVYFSLDDRLGFYNLWGTDLQTIETTQAFRDTSAWYHIVVAVDLNQASYTNGVKMYVNGVQITSFSTTTYTDVFKAGAIGGPYTHYIGCDGQPSATGYFDGYLTEVNVINGQQLTPSSFGKYNSYGIWSPKKYSGTYGTNGFYLNFNRYASVSNLGLDSSGNGLNFTSNHSITYDTYNANDVMYDVPTLTSPTAANYATLSYLDRNFNTTLVWGNLNAGDNSGGGSTWRSLRASIFMTAGKFYYECGFDYLNTSSSPPAYGGIGILSRIDLMADTQYVGSHSDSYSIIVTNTAAYTYNNSTVGATYTGTYLTSVSGGRFQVAVDIDAGKIWFGYNNSWFGGGNPATGTSPNYTFTPGTPYAPAICYYNSSGPINFGQHTLTYTPPAGFNRVNTYNLPRPTIPIASAYMSATTWAGDGLSPRAIDNGVSAVSFKPDFVWLKNRTSAYGHRLTNSINPTVFLASETTGAEQTNYGAFSFLPNGISVSASINDNNIGDNYIAWQWKAGGATTVTNTDGSTSSQVSVNQPAGFSIVKFVAPSTNNQQTFGHGLGAAPEFILAKSRDSTVNWPVFHSSVCSTTTYLLLNTTNAVQTYSSPSIWGGVLPTSTTFGATGAGIGPANGNMIAYCWRSIPGYSLFGYYIGNSSADGPFVNCGFKPRFLMVKCSNTAGTEWIIWDSGRNGYNTTNSILYPNQTYTEYSGSLGAVDFVSNGFKLRNTNSGSASSNISGWTYVYAAFAENPFKYTLAR